VKSSSSGNNRKNILKNPSSLDFKIRTFLIDQSRVDIMLCLKKKKLSSPTISRFKVSHDLKLEEFNKKKFDPRTLLGGSINIENN
jgi:hypothetical protein